MNIFTKLLLAISLISFWASTYASSTTRADAFIYFANQYKNTVPVSYQYINLDYKNIPVDSELEDALQILVYLDLIKNRSIDIWAYNNISEKELISMNQLLMPKVEKPKTATIKINSSLNTSWNLWEKEKILHDVYKTISNSHYDKGTFEENQLTQWAIKGIADAVWDKYTSYFPPVESNDFFEGLEWEYEWIGSYVDMQTPGQLIIVSPIVWSPSEKAGVKWGDRVTHVDDKEITENTPLSEVISWIKGPAWTNVKLTISREEESKPLEILVTREKIILKDVEHKKLNRNTYYIQIKNFWDRVDTEFKQALEAVLEEHSTDKIIFDLRNNPGWYLGEVSTMLSYFIEAGKPTAIVNSWDRELKYNSAWYDLINFNNYELVFLQNGWSASASEIMVWSVKDYYPDTIIIGEQSFWKWSVQTLKTYSDGSTLKYTTAKWFTGNTKIWIDGVWITPDVEIIFDEERWRAIEKDNQLEEAISY